VGFRGARFSVPARTSLRASYDFLGVAQRSAPAGDVYLKLTVIDDVLIVSFKEL
jgi:hypothetical protein